MYKLLGLAALTMCTVFAADKSTEKLIKEVRHELVMLPNLSLWDNLAYFLEPGRLSRRKQ